MEAGKCLLPFYALLGVSESACEWQNIEYMLNIGSAVTSSFWVFFPFRGVLFFASWYVFNSFYSSSKVCSIRPQTTAERKGRLSQLLTLIACCLISLSLLPNGMYVGFRGQEGL